MSVLDVAQRTVVFLFCGAWDGLKALYMRTPVFHVLLAIIEISDGTDSLVHEITSVGGAG